nr:MAG TPA: hypothetical protein [Bacteriophage sp.]
MRRRPHRFRCGLRGLKVCVYLPAMTRVVRVVPSG